MLVVPCSGACLRSQDWRRVLTDAASAAATFALLVHVELRASFSIALNSDHTSFVTPPPRQSQPTGAVPESEAVSAGVQVPQLLYATRRVAASVAGLFRVDVR